ncbi:MAG: glycosyltransferase [Candidatus Obscuribacter sp.]|nr:glycosyltransferase [Candidatus Obscuribacter sp.]
MLLSIVIVSWNTRDLLRASLVALKAEVALLQSQIPGATVETFLVDNASADGSAAMAASEHPWVHLIANNDNLGFAKANNQAFKLSTGDFVLLLNPDTEIKPGALFTLLEFLKSHPEAGIVAPQLLNSDGSIQRSCREFPTFKGMLYELIGLSRMFSSDSAFGQEVRRYKMLDFAHDHARQVDQPEGACLLVKREIFDKVGTLDEGFLCSLKKWTGAFVLSKRATRFGLHRMHKWCTTTDSPLSK